MSVTVLADRDRQRLAAAPWPYDEVGATVDELPAGYRHVRRQAVIGTGRSLFDRAGADLLAWQVQSRSGIEVRASHPTAVKGTVVQLAIGLRGLAVLAPCRVVYLVAEEHRTGFAYGTLPGHPQRGEESFVVAFDPPTDQVTLHVTAFSRPATLLTRLGGPVATLAQDLMTRRYLRALG
jgi:uncharacterized protein (UPF0548 family)